LADAPDLGSGGRPWGFDSLHPQFNTKDPGHHMTWVFSIDMRSCLVYSFIL